VHPACATFTVLPATVSVPVRARLVLAGTLNVTLPSPLPLAPDATEIQLALLFAVHSQPGADTVIGELVMPVMGTETLVGFTEATQAACVTVTIWPATESVPVRAAPELDAMLSDIRTLPVPLSAPVMEIHNALLLADQSHPAGAVNDTTLEVEPEADAEILSGATVYVQLGAAGGTPAGGGVPGGGVPAGGGVPGGDVPGGGAVVPFASCSILTV
jgi:hypothetical protein